MVHVEVASKNERDTPSLPFIGKSWSEVRRGVSRPRDDDDMSVNLTEHAKRRLEERDITLDDVRRAKRQGKMLFCILLNVQEDPKDAKDEINWWVDRLKEVFEKLEVGDVTEKGPSEDRRVQVELRGSENRGPATKE
jgi:hypothetical protein